VEQEATFAHQNLPGAEAACSDGIILLRRALVKVKDFAKRSDEKFTT
jgi:hypothetical protein